MVLAMLRAFSSFSSYIAISVKYISFFLERIFIYENSIYFVIIIYVFKELLENRGNDGKIMQPSSFKEDIVTRPGLYHMQCCFRG